MRRTPLKSKRATPRRNEGRVQHLRAKRKRGDRNAVENEHIARVGKMLCLLTGSTEKHIHHLLVAPGKRAGRDHRWIVPLAPWLHNMGRWSVHGIGSEAGFEEHYGLPAGWFIAEAEKLWEESNVR